MNEIETKYYKKFYKEMILRDYLALDRTILANRRTLLSFARTSVGLLAGGIGMVKLVADTFTNVVGYLFILVSFPTMIIGIAEYYKMKKNLSEIEKKEEKNEENEN